MDAKTIQAYDADAAQWVSRYNSLVPELLQQMARQYLHVGKPTLDIGCGSGRDLKFLNAAGFPTTGLDASQGMLAECQKAYPEYSYVLDTLPQLAKVESESFDNAYSSAVLMHLSVDDFATAVRNIYRIMRCNGRFVFNYRPATGDEERETDGRLFSGLDPERVRDVLEATGFEILAYEVQSEKRSPKLWHHFGTQKGSKP